MDSNCSVYKTVDFIGKRWTLLILLELFKADGEMRYSEVKRSLPGITPKILSLRLKELGKEGLVTKKIDNSHIPISCSYSLTDSGAAFIPIIQEIKQWSLDWKFKNSECMAQDCSQCQL